MTVQADQKADFEAKLLLSKWNLQFDRAEQYLRQFVIVIFAFSLTVCGFIISNPGYEANFGIPAFIAIGIYFSVFLFGLFSKVDFTDLKVIYSIQGPIASLIPVWCILLAGCHYFLEGSAALSYALLSLYFNICILFIAFLATVIQLREDHMCCILIFVVQFTAIAELYGFVWLGYLMKEMILNGEIPL